MSCRRGHRSAGEEPLSLNDVALVSCLAGHIFELQFPQFLQLQQAAVKVGSMTGDRNLVGLVNNAGIVVSGPLLYLRPSEYRRQLDVNMIAPLVVIQAFAPLLGTDKKRRGPAGRIVNISSRGAKVAIPVLGAYSAAIFGKERIRSLLLKFLIPLHVMAEIGGRHRR
jgi:NAD(P)-dependent dehydrogenase (short-subunit alcohol dehydrogenase family)